MRLSKPLFYTIIVVVFFLLFMCIKMSVSNDLNKSDYEKNALIREGVIKQLESELNTEKLKSNKLIIQRDSLVSIANSYDKANYTHKINYEKKKDIVIHLNDDDQILYFANEVSK